MSSARWLMVCLVAFLVFTGLALSGNYLPGERGLVLALALQRLSFLNPLVQLASLFGSMNVILPLWLGLLIALAFRREWLGLLSFIPTLLGYPLYALLKTLIARPGPMPPAVPRLHDFSIGYFAESLLRTRLAELPPLGVSVPVVAQPVTVESVTRVMESGYPSGHALLAVIFYGGLAWWLWEHSAPGNTRTLIVALLLALASAPGLARVYMGVHYPSDVFGAWLLGGVFIVSARWIAQLLTPKAAMLKMLSARHFARVEKI